MISPTECQHKNTIFIQGSNYTGVDCDHSRHTVSVCADCGQFSVWGDKNGVHFNVTFTLPTDELVQAAGQYARYLAKEESYADRLAQTAPRLLAACRAAEELLSRLWTPNAPTVADLALLRGRLRAVIAATSGAGEAVEAAVDSESWADTSPGGWNLKTS